MVPPKIPYGGFSPVRLQGRCIRRGLPGCTRSSPAVGLPSPFVHLAYRVCSPFCTGERAALVHLRSSGFRHSTPGALAPVRVIVSRTTSLSQPHAPHSQAHLDFTVSAYTRCHRCAPHLNA